MQFCRDVNAHFICDAIKTVMALLCSQYGSPHLKVNTPNQGKKCLWLCTGFYMSVAVVGGVRHHHHGRTFTTNRRSSSNDEVTMHALG